MFSIIGWWNDTDSSMNGDICIMEWITDIHNPSNKSMHSFNRNVDSEGFSMCHWTIVMIKINTLNLRTTIYTVIYNKYPCIITVAFLNTFRNEQTEDLCSVREVFYWCRSRKKADIFCSFNIAQMYLLSVIFSEDPIELHLCSLGW